MTQYEIVSNIGGGECVLYRTKQSWRADRMLKKIQNEYLQQRVNAGVKIVRYTDDERIETIEQKQLF